MAGKKVNPVAGLNYNQLAIKYSKGELSYNQIIKGYKSMRETVTRQLRRIKSSDVPFIDEDSVPRFKTVAEMGTVSDILHELADINRFRESAYYSISERRKTRDSVIAKLRASGFDVDGSNWVNYIAFIRWYQAHIDAIAYDSKDRKLIAFFNANKGRKGANTMAKWQRMFREWKQRGKFEEVE